MTFRGLVLAATVLSGTVVAVPAAADVGCGGPIKPASVMTVSACDSPDRVVAKAAAVVPRKGQLAWQQRPVTAFTPFGMNTFTDRAPVLMAEYRDGWLDHWGEKHVTRDPRQIASYVDACWRRARR